MLGAVGRAIDHTCQPETTPCRWLRRVAEAAGTRRLRGSACRRRWCQLRSKPWCGCGGDGFPSGKTCPRSRAHEAAAALGIRRQTDIIDIGAALCGDRRSKLRHRKRCVPLRPLRARDRGVGGAVGTVKTHTLRMRVVPPRMVPDRQNLDWVSSVAGGATVRRRADGRDGRSLGLGAVPAVGIRTAARRGRDAQRRCQQASVRHPGVVLDGSLEAHENTSHSAVPSCHER